MQLPGLKAQREVRGLTQLELRARSGISVPTIVKIERGGECTPGTGKALADALALVPIPAAMEALVGAPSP